MLLSSETQLQIIPYKKERPMGLKIDVLPEGYKVRRPRRLSTLTSAIYTRTPAGLVILILALASWAGLIGLIQFLRWVVPLSFS